MAVLGTALPKHVHPGSECLTGFQGGEAKFAAIVVRPFVRVENFECLRRLAEAIEFAGHEVLGSSRRPHSRIPADAVKPSGHFGAAKQSRFAPQTPGVAIAEGAFQGAVYEQI
jgi:hypothetical protein